MADGPIGSRKSRVQKALYWHWTRDMTYEEIGEKLGVAKSTVGDYVSEAPTSPAVQNALDARETEVRFIAARKLRDQLVEAGERAATAKKPVKVWRGDGGDVLVKDKRNEAGELTGRYPVPADFEMGADEQGRYYGRTEVREILDLLTDIVGAKAADRQEIELSGELDTDTSLSEEDREWLDGRFGGNE